MRSAAVSLAILTAACTSLPAGAENQVPPTKAACEAAQDYLKIEGRIGKPPNSITASPPTLSLGRPPASRLAEGWQGRAPSIELIERFLDRDSRSALSCASVRTEIQRRGGEVVENFTAKIDQSGRYKGSGLMTSLGMPVVSVDGKSALIFVTYVGQGLSSGESLIALTLSGGAWTVSGRKMISIS